MCFGKLKSRFAEAKFAVEHGLSRRTIFESKRGATPFDVRVLLNKHQAVVSSVTLLLPLAQILQTLSVEYKVETGDFWKYPAETVLDGGGDCEDLAFLAAGLLIAKLKPEDRWRVFVLIFSEPPHACVLFDGRMFDPERREWFMEIPGGWRLWYLFNCRNAYIQMGEGGSPLCGDFSTSGGTP